MDNRLLLQKANAGWLILRTGFDLDLQPVLVFTAPFAEQWAGVGDLLPQKADVGRLDTQGE